MTTGYPYVWVWRWRTVGPPARKVPWFADGVDRAGRACRVVVRSTRMNSVLIEFEDGYRVVTSRGGMRRRTGQRATKR